MKRLCYLALFALLLVKLATSQDTTSCPNIPDNEKIDCLPAQEAPSQAACSLRKCCYKVTKDNVQIPACYYPRNYPGYAAGSRSYQDKRENGVEATFSLVNPSGFDGDVKEIRATVQYASSNIIRIRVEDPAKKRFEPPVPEIPTFRRVTKNDSLNYEVTMGKNPMSVKVTRKSSNETIFDTNIGAFAMADQFMEITTRLSTNYLYGIGEHSTGTGAMRGGKKRHYTLFNRGELVRAGHPNFNLYGTHPMFINLEKSGAAHGVFLLNSNAMEIITYETPQLTYRVIGGIFDFFIFLGPTADDVISQYTSVIGRPFLPPYWTLGFHLCRYEYNTTAETRKVWKRNVDAGIYFEAQWQDIDYMEDRKCFTYDRVRYRGLPELVDEIHAAGMHYMMITDPGLDGDLPKGSYQPTDEARALDLLIKDYKGDELIALVWQNATVFVDFSNPDSTDYWMRQFKTLYDQIPYDGAWIDMNEPYSFVNGSHDGCPADNKLDNPPFVPGKDFLYNGTICMSAQQHIGAHYYAHSLYGIQEGIATNKAMAKILKKRPFVLSRATFPGYGHFGAHWLGDVWSRWEYMQDSVERMITMNIYGIPMIGTDICGFTGNTTVELCQRWTALGAFYPFSRNHNDRETIAQDPAGMGPEMIALHKKNFAIRYYLLPHLYTLLYNSHIHGLPVIRPLVYDYPTDSRTYEIKNSFQWGKSLLFIPVLDQGKTNVTTYIPRGVWYDYYTSKMIVSAGQDMTFDAPLDTINILVKGGSVIPAQNPSTTLVESRKNSFHLLVSLDEKGEARGDLYWDDGIAIESVSENKFNYVTFSVSNRALNIQAVTRGFPTEMKLERVIILGVPNAVTYAANHQTRVDHHYEAESERLVINLMDVSLLEDNVLTWGE